MVRVRRFGEVGQRRDQLESLIAKARSRAITLAMTKPKTLDALPMAKRRELNFVVEVLQEEFARKTANRTTPGLANSKLLKVILYGSYARGDWVEDPVGRYFSDFDILVVTSTEDAADFPEIWADAERRLMEELAEGRNLRTPVSLITHSIDDVNQQLEKGRYFFVDIVREGLVLLSAPGHPFAEAKPIAAEAALVEARKYFADASAKYGEIIRSADHALESGSTNWTAFLLQQAAEVLYQCLMLVMTLHTPKSHNLTRLRQMTEGFDPRLPQVWPTESKFQKRSFELLKQGYVNARYSEHYRVTNEELSFMRERIEILGGLVVEISQAQIAALEAASKTS